MILQKIMSIIGFSFFSKASVGTHELHNTLLAMVGSHLHFRAAYNPAAVYIPNFNCNCSIDLMMSGCVNVVIVYHSIRLMK